MNGNKAVTMNMATSFHKRTGVLSTKDGASLHFNGAGLYVVDRAGVNHAIDAANLASQLRDIPHDKLALLIATKAVYFMLNQDDSGAYTVKMNARLELDADPEFRILYFLRVQFHQTKNRTGLAKSWCLQCIHSGTVYGNVWDTVNHLFSESMVDQALS